jgi:hypothetical protein
MWLRSEKVPHIHFKWKPDRDDHRTAWTTFGLKLGQHRGYSRLYNRGAVTFARLTKGRTVRTTPPSCCRAAPDNLGMRKLPQTAAEDLLRLIMRRYERRMVDREAGDQSTTG